MMHLRNFRQISIEEVRQVMTCLPVEVPLPTETVEDWRQLELSTPCEKFLATPLELTAVHESSKVIDLGANRKRICNFLLVINSNFGLDWIAQCFTSSPTRYRLYAWEMVFTGNFECISYVFEILAHLAGNGLFF